MLYFNPWMVLECSICNGFIGCRLYNFGDVFQYDEELTHKRRKKVEEMKKEFCKLFNQKYDNTSYYIEDGKLTVKISVSDRALKNANWNKERKFTIDL